MRVLMLTNTYRPVLSGVAKSVKAFEEEYRRLGHDVLVIAPEPDDPQVVRDDGETVVRVPAIQHFNGSQFPVPVPAPGLVLSTVEEFQPDIVHAHHPFLMGSTAMRLARPRDLPLVFTYHTMWDQYTHYASADSAVASRFIGALAAGYANLCEAVIAPSRSIAELLHERGVTTRVEVIPTGVDVPRFECGDGAAFRQKQGIPNDAFVAGYVGRLEPEKNLRFLSSAIAQFAQDDPSIHFLVVGSGSSDADIREVFEQTHISDRLHLAGACEGQDLIDAYHALDMFVFASQSETQGMVLTEAMAAGAPVVALDGPGVHDVIEDRVNGRLVWKQDVAPFCAALAWMFEQGGRRNESLSRAAKQTAERFSMPRQAQKVLHLYQSLIDRIDHSQDSASILARAGRRLEAEWDLWSNVAHAASCALETDAPIDALRRQ
jgi:1,2-diacylglycerol 3-alpha-glucosyltransferase